MNDLKRQTRNRRLNWTGWAVLAGYVMVLYLMARAYWHAKIPFVFLGAFVVLTVLLVLAFRVLHRLEGGAGDKK